METSEAQCTVIPELTQLLLNDFNFILSYLKNIFNFEQVIS